MPKSHVRREAMEISGKALVRRWGGRAVGLAVTGIGLYVVAPSLLTMFGAWPQLADVEVRWFVVLAALETCSFAALWWLARIALTPAPGAAAGAADPTGGPGRARDRAGARPRLPSWPGTPRARSCRVEPPRAAWSRPRCSSAPGSRPTAVASGLTAVEPAQRRRPVAAAGPHHPGPHHRTASGRAAPARPARLADPGRGHRRGRRHRTHLARGGRRDRSRSSAGSCTWSGRSVTPDGHGRRPAGAARPDRRRVPRALVASRVRGGREPHVRLRRPRRRARRVRGRTPGRPRSCSPTSSRRRSRSSRSPPVVSGSSTPA